MPHYGAQKGGTLARRQTGLARQPGCDESSTMKTVRDVISFRLHSGKVRNCKGFPLPLCIQLGTNYAKPAFARPGFLCDGFFAFRAFTLQS
jgi:hypothetical protein